MSDAILESTMQSDDFDWRENGNHGLTHPDGGIVGRYSVSGVDAQRPLARCVVDGVAREAPPRWRLRRES